MVMAPFTDRLTPASGLPPAITRPLNALHARLAASYPAAGGVVWLKAGNVLTVNKVQKKKCE
ncbi:hypothetical protein GCM10027422_08990 [Hymenobacter arcticus]